MQLLFSSDIHSISGMDQSIENRIHELGLGLFASVNKHRPIPMSRAWLDDQGMAWTMKDEQLKIQLFRFVDALPGLKSASDIAHHLCEYLTPVADRLPAGRLLPHITKNALTTQVAAAAARFGVKQLAHRFIAGSDVQSTIAAVTKFRRQRLTFTVDLLGEAILSSHEADCYAQAYHDIMTGLHAAAHTWPTDDLIDRDHRGAIPKINISIKLSALVNRFDPADVRGTKINVRKRLDPLLYLAKKLGIFINIDMEQNSYRPLTIDILTDIIQSPDFRSWPDIGIAIQAYLKASGDDLKRLHALAEKRGAPIWIRLVKGAYHDYERVIAHQQGWPVPVFTDKAATDANYELLTTYLLDRYEVLRPAFASHNVRSIATILAQAEQRHLPKGAIEFQMLYGMADSLKTALVDRGQRVRVYAPYGALLPGMAYLVRRLLENTSNQSFVRVGFIEHRDQGELLMKPQPRPVAEKVEQQQAFKNEPLLDFSSAANRDHSELALKKIRDQFPISVPLIINGKELTTENTLPSRCPSYEDLIIAQSALADKAMAEFAIAAAKAVFPAWRNRPVEDRACLLDKLADELLRQRFELSALIVYESGKSFPEADADVAEAIDFCRFYAHDMRRLDQPRKRDLLGEHNRMIYEARGVTVVISPWNFPLAILTGMAVAGLVCGNTVIMKPAEQTPAIASALMNAMVTVGFPAGVVQLVPGIGEEIGPVFINSPDVSVLAFTGSLAVGQLINRQAAAAGGDEIKRVICEMGGKNAIIIDDDADLDEAVTGVVASAFGYQGQKCSACSRAIVLSSIYDQFVKRLIETTESLAIGPAENPSSHVGPVIDREARDRIRKRIALAQGEGTLAYAGTVPSELDNQGNYVAPHIFTEVQPQSSLAQEEIFGPVLAVIRVENMNEALRVANDTKFALSGGCYSRSPLMLERVAKEFRVGNLYLNRKITGALVDVQPFGGFKLSGIGSKAGGPDYLLQFMIPRCITENTLRHGFTPDLP